MLHLLHLPRAPPFMSTFPLQLKQLPPFHTGTMIQIIPGFRHSHWQVNPDSIQIENQIADPGAK